MRSWRSALLAVAVAAASPAWPDTPPLKAEQVQAAVDAVREDPKLGGTRSERSLRWKPDRPSTTNPPKPPAPWLIELLRWIAESGRVLVWLLGAAALALVIVLARRWLAVHAEGRGARLPTMPSHVRDLDIRPQSLPDDIAAAARALWLRGEQRAALSLLYRGALSRLVHDHAVPIRSASTEGECVQLAARKVSADAAAFFERLVSVWLLNIYGGRSPESAQVLGLCDHFDTRLPAKRPAVSA